MLIKKTRDWKDIIQYWRINNGIPIIKGGSRGWRKGWGHCHWIIGIRRVWRQKLMRLRPKIKSTRIGYQLRLTVSWRSLRVWYLISEISWEKMISNRIYKEWIILIKNIRQGCFIKSWINIGKHLISRIKNMPLVNYCSRYHFRKL